MDHWTLEYTAFEPESQGTREALCTLANGYFALRGAFEECQADDVHYPGTYLAGGYNRLKTEVEGHVIENEALVNFSNPLVLKFRIGEEGWFGLNEVEIVSFRQTLHLKEGILEREVTFKDGRGRETRVKFTRFVSMDECHLAAIKMELSPLNWEGEIEIQSGLDGRVKNSGVARYRQLSHHHLECILAKACGEESLLLEVRTNQSHLHMAQGARTRLFVDGGAVAKSEVLEEPGFVAHFFRFTVKKHSVVVVEKVISLFTSKDHAISECALAAREMVVRADSFSELLERHKLAWIHLWRRFDIQIACSVDHEMVAQLLRLPIFHMLQTTSLHTRDLDVGVPPRGWHGEAYRGHILWDELFVFSTLNLQLPELTRALLMYRYRRLPAARRAAKEAGFRGAMYPWQSGSDGREESQKIHLNPLSKRWISDHSYLQRHVNAAIAYNVWQHFEATGDLEFLSFYGAEMLFEIARFFAHLARFCEDKGRYVLLGVMGPDEFHDGYPGREGPGIDNNTYTNVMAAWVLTRALQTVELLPHDRKRELKEMMSLGDEECATWEEIACKLFIPFHSDGVLSQFEGYEDLEEFDWEGYRHKHGDIERLDRILEAEGRSVNAYKASKQADVLMLFFLFSVDELRSLFEKMGYELTGDCIEKTISYYLTRTAHGSTLSRLVHSWVLARYDRKMSWEFFHQLLLSDVEDIQGGTTKEGIHLGAMAGTVDLLQRCYTGIEYRGDTLRFNPSLPDEIHQLRTIIRYRGHTLLIHVTQDKLEIKSERVSALPIQIAYHDHLYSLAEGEKREFKLP